MTAAHGFTCEPLLLYLKRIIVLIKANIYKNITPYGGCVRAVCVL